MTEAPRPGIDVQQILLATATDGISRIIFSEPTELASRSHRSVGESIRELGFKPVRPPTSDGNELVEFRRLNHVSEHPEMTGIVVQEITVHLSEDRGEPCQVVCRVFKPQPPQTPQISEYS